MTADRNCLARWKGCLQSLNEGTLFLPRLDCLFEEDGVDAQVQQLMTRCFRLQTDTGDLARQDTLEVCHPI